MHSEQTISTDFHSKPRKLRLLLAIFTVFAAVVVLAKATPAIERQLNDWKLLPRHDSLTELYVTNPQQLPESYAVGRTHDVDFTLHNLEGKSVLYHYSIVITNAAGVASEVRTGTFQLADGQIRHNIVPIDMADYGKRIRIQVHLTNTTDISYWLDRK